MLGAKSDGAMSSDAGVAARSMRAPIMAQKMIEARRPRDTMARFRFIFRPAAEMATTHKIRNAMEEREIIHRVL
jgi:hypothetical protein